MLHKFSLLIALAVVSVLPSCLSTGRGGFNAAAFVEGDQFEGPRKVAEQTRPDGTKRYFRRVPIVTTSSITAFFPFPADGGTYGVALRLDDSGWNRIRETAMSSHGKQLLILVNARPVQAMRIDMPRTDDHMLIIWRGITEAEVAALRKDKKEIKSDSPAPEPILPLPQPSSRAPLPSMVPTAGYEPKPELPR